MAIMSTAQRRTAPHAPHVATKRVRDDLNPHPAGQMDLNLPMQDGAVTEVLGLVEKPKPEVAPSRLGGAPPPEGPTY